MNENEYNEYNEKKKMADIICFSCCELFFFLLLFAFYIIFFVVFFLFNITNTSESNTKCSGISNIINTKKKRDDVVATGAADATAVATIKVLITL